MFDCVVSLIVYGCAKVSGLKVSWHVFIVNKSLPLNYTVTVVFGLWSKCTSIASSYPRIVTLAPVDKMSIYALTNVAANATNKLDLSIYI